VICINLPIVVIGNCQRGVIAELKLQHPALYTSQKKFSAGVATIDSGNVILHGVFPGELERIEFNINKFVVTGTASGFGREINGYIIKPCQPKLQFNLQPHRFFLFNFATVRLEREARSELAIDGSRRPCESPGARTGRGPNEMDRVCLDPWIQTEEVDVENTEKSFISGFRVTGVGVAKFVLPNARLRTLICPDPHLNYLEL
jgi:hypothetical protein